MDIAKKSRTDLKAYFVKNAIPTESNFADLIDAMVNQKEDGLAKTAGNPLSIEATGDASSLRKAINFYESFADANPLIEVGPDQSREVRVLVTARDPLAKGASIPIVFTIVPRAGGYAASASDHFFGP